MGRDKLSLEVGGVPLLERTRRALSEFCSEILIVGDEGANARANVAPRLSRRLSDSRAGKQGPLAGLEAGLTASENRLIFAVAGDMPFISASLAVHLCQTLESGRFAAAVPVFGERVNPLCAAYSRGILGEVSDALDLGTRSVTEFLGSLERVEYVESGLERFGDPEMFLMNVNSPQDLALARSLA